MNPQIRSTLCSLALLLGATTEFRAQTVPTATPADDSDVLRLDDLKITAATVWNATLNYRATPSLGLFLTVKNLADKTPITDRTRGIQVGQPRLVHASARYAF